MALTKSEVINLVNNAVKIVSTYGSKVNKIINDLNEVSVDLSKIASKINESIVADDINTATDNYINKISNEISNTIKLGETAVKTAVSNCNNYIDYLENEYNSSCKKKEDKISIQRMSGLSVGGVVTKTILSSSGSSKSNENVTASVKTKQTERITKSYRPLNGTKETTSVDVKNVKVTKTSEEKTTKRNDESSVKLVDDNDKSNTTTTNKTFIKKTSTPVTIEHYFNNILEINLKNNIDSNNISGWNEYVNKLLINNNLDGTIDSIHVSNHIVSCVSKMGKQVSFENVNSVTELINRINMIF